MSHPARVQTDTVQICRASESRMAKEETDPLLLLFHHLPFHYFLLLVLRSLDRGG